METRVVRGVDVVRLAASLGVRFARTQVTPRSSAPNETHVSGQMYQMALYVRSKVASSARRHKSFNSFKEVSDISLLRLNPPGKDCPM